MLPEFDNHPRAAHGSITVAERELPAVYFKGYGLNYTL